MLRLVRWMEVEEAAGLRAGRGWSTAPEQADLLDRFCRAHDLPWGPCVVPLTAVDGAVPAGRREAEAGRVRVEVDVPWILQDLKLAASTGVQEELLALWAREQAGEPVDRPLRRVRVLAGLPPAAREEALLALVRRTGAAEVLLFRPLSDDDVDRYVEEA
jgi:hypothetical protein